MFVSFPAIEAMAQYEYNQRRREEARQKQWLDEYSQAPHETRLEMIELEKLRLLREDLKTRNNNFTGVFR